MITTSTNTGQSRLFVNMAATGIGALGLLLCVLVLRGQDAMSVAIGVVTGTALIVCALVMMFAPRLSTLSSWVARQEGTGIGVWLFLSIFLWIGVMWTGGLLFYDTIRTLMGSPWIPGTPPINDYDSRLLLATWMVVIGTGLFLIIARGVSKSRLDNE